MVIEKNRKKYQQPLVDLLECRVERGFLESFSYGNYYGSDLGSPSGNDGNGSGYVEGFSNGNAYGGEKFN